MQDKAKMIGSRSDRMCSRARLHCQFSTLLFLPLCLCASVALSPILALAADAPAASQPSSFYRDVRPVLMANCNACHKPDKTKAELDMTSYAALLKGGKHGKTVVPGKPDDSRLIEEITGDEPTMPKEGDPLKAQQVAAITRWIADGAKDDTPPPGTTKVEAPEYTVAPSRHRDRVFARWVAARRRGLSRGASAQIGRLGFDRAPCGRVIAH